MRMEVDVTNVLTSPSHTQLRSEATATLSGLIDIVKPASILISFVIFFFFLLQWDIYIFGFGLLITLNQLFENATVKGNFLYLHD